MNLTRKNIICMLSCLLAVQIIILCFLYVFNFQSNKTRSIDKLLIGGITENNITNLEITDYQDTFSVKKEAVGWSVVTKDGNIMPADAAKIKNYLADLAKINQGLLVANGGSEVDSKYGFDEKNKQDLTVTVNNKKYTITIGNNGSKRGTSYIKFNGTNKIREINSSISSETSNDPINWARRTIVNSIMDNDVQNYKMESSLSWYQGGYSFTAKDPKVKDNTNDAPDTYVLDTPSEKKLSDYVMQHLVKDFLTMRCSEYKFNATVAGREKLAGITVTLKNNTVRRFDFYKADEDDIGDYIVDNDADNYLYLIHEDDLKKVIREL